MKYIKDTIKVALIGDGFTIKGECGPLNEASMYVERDGEVFKVTIDDSPDKEEVEAFNNGK